MPLTDETAGEFILWVPASMMMIIAIAIVIHDWNLTEEKRLRQGYGYSGPEYAAPEAEGQGNGDRTLVLASSRRLGLLLGFTALTMFGLAIGTGVFIVSLG
ncbi:MAG TPA: hypothetical protein ENH55_17440 [Aurantimonas coralicida]|uniref:Uncharacterized protein n=2 Tax=root TaxID=1 RepID=A0A0F9TFY7_9ZZZZ|nr:hypothetical protein [Aurantimonas coralicida]